MGSTLFFYKDSGYLPKAVQYLINCVKIAEKIALDNVESRSAQWSLSAWYYRFGELLKEMKGANEAKDFYDKSLKIMEDLSAKSPNDVSLLASLGKCYYRIANVYNNIGETEQFRKYLKKSHKTFLKGSELSKDDLDAQQSLSISLDGLGRVRIK